MGNLNKRTHRDQRDETSEEKIVNIRRRQSVSSDNFPNALVLKKPTSHYQRVEMIAVENTIGNCRKRPVPSDRIPKALVSKKPKIRDRRDEISEENIVHIRRRQSISQKYKSQELKKERKRCVDAMIEQYLYCTCSTTHVSKKDDELQGPSDRMRKDLVSKEARIRDQRGEISEENIVHIRRRQSLSQNYKSQELKKERKRCVPSDRMRKDLVSKEARIRDQRDEISEENIVHIRRRQSLSQNYKSQELKKKVYGDTMSTTRRNQTAIERVKNVADLNSPRDGGVHGMSVEFTEYVFHNSMQALTKRAKTDPKVEESDEDRMQSSERRLSRKTKECGNVAQEHSASETSTNGSESMIILRQTDFSNRDDFFTFQDPDTKAIGEFHSCSDGGVEIEWISDSFVASCEKLGRIYFGGFHGPYSKESKKSTMDDEMKKEKTFCMGDKICIYETGKSPVLAQIVSCYQATKTFNFLERNELVNAQAAGHPYMEIRILRKKQKLPTWTSRQAPKFPPCWLQWPGLVLTKINSLHDQLGHRPSPTLVRNLRRKMLAAATMRNWPKGFFVVPENENTIDDDVSAGGDDDDDNVTLNCAFDDKDKEIEVSCLDEGIFENEDNSNLVHTLSSTSESDTDSDSTCHIDNNVEGFCSKPNLCVKSYIRRTCQNYNWGNACRRQLSEYQLVVYDNKWATSIDSNKINFGEAVTEREKAISEECKLIGTKLCMKFVNDVSLVELAKRPLESLVDVIYERDCRNETAASESSEIKLNREYFGYSDFNPLFNRVIEDLVRKEIGRQPVGPKPDVILQAPCGSGKSSCFSIASHIIPGITLVIEPLRALIDSQLDELSRRGFKVEKLLSYDDARALQNAHAKLRLNELHGIYTQLGGSSKEQEERRRPMMLFCTPEVFRGIENEVRLCSRDRLISMIVVDEYDFIGEANNSYRDVYLNLLQTLRSAAPNVQLFFLSATFSRELINEVVQSYENAFDNPRSKSRLYRAENPLPAKHRYSVRRKTDDTEIANFIANTVVRSRDKCICYCLTRSNCNKLKEMLLHKGVTAECFYRTQTPEVHKDVLEGFNGNIIQVLCATKSLGRGVHISCPVNFVFHTTMPLSLTDYVQETGRGGRYGEECECILFYRDQDQAIAERIVLGEGEKRSVMVKQQVDVALARLQAVRQYAIEGSVCRYVMLAASSVSQASYKQRCPFPFTCDNCQKAEEYEDVSITHIVAAILKQTNSCADVGMFYEAAMKVAEQYFHERDKFLICSLLSYEKSRIKSLADFLYRLLTKHFAGRVKSMNEQQEYREGSVITTDVDFFLRNWRNSNAVTPLKTSAKNVAIRQHSPKRSSHSKILGTPLVFQGKSCPNISMFPYLVQYELTRLDLLKCNDEAFWRELDQNCAISLYGACKLVYKKKKLAMPSLFKKLENPDSEKQKAAAPFFFKLDLMKYKEKEFKWKLHPPELAFDRRMYRHYGEDRFLEVSVSSNFSLDEIIRDLDGPQYICGRTFRFLWCKKDKSPQAFIFFAERGVGISPENEIGVKELMERCIPRTLNSDLTISKYSKRMKLCFSTTVKAALLDQNCIKILPDFNLEEAFSEIDGAGLISTAALELVWKAYNTPGIAKENLEFVPSGFQGRIGGFKGVWILDPSLGGDNGTDIVVQCRTRQCKYHSLSDCEPWRSDCFQNTVEICSWNKKQNACLNTRIIQILEHFALQVGKEEQLREVILNCMEETFEQMKDYCSDDSKRICKDLKTINKRFCNDSNPTESEKYDSRQLYKMFLGNVPFDEPEFVKRKKRFLEKKFGGIRDEARYPVAESCTLRMIPDHTMLLEEGEAFLALSGNYESDDPLNAHPIDDVICMRSPSYFPGDLRRLKVIDIATIEARAVTTTDGENIPTILRRTAAGKVMFFKGMKYSLILSNKGPASEAHRMSGGDYDGDTAWICWHRPLLNCLPLLINPSPFLDLTETKPENDKCVWDCPIVDVFEYNFNFRHHKNDLCSFSTRLDVAIDRYGFEDDLSILLGKAAFVEVDTPYKNPHRMEDAGCEPLLKKFPHWKHRDPMYESKRLLGIMWTTMDKKMQGIGEIKSSSECCLPMRIKEFLVKCTNQAASSDLESIKAKVRREAENYLKLREEVANVGHKEKLFQWRDQYCAERQRDLLPGIVCGTPDIVVAALLYDQCRRLDAENTTNRHATEFAWSVAEHKLYNILAPDGIQIDKQREFLLHC